ncbi:MAG: winged helix DNA-binding domain-containing protein [Hamadaea sp.]|nr:winged helix DNA-binding domain-containing protein [Hamadaea sp.]
MRRHLLDRPAKPTVPAVVDRLCGVQAQVASSAELAVAVRRAKPAQGLTTTALAEKKLLKTWAMRGTLHLLTPAAAPAHLSLLASAKTWQKPVWQRTFAPLEQMEKLAAAAFDVLDGAILTREQLVDAVLERTQDAALREHLTSGWGTLLKPLAWQGLLINGPGDGGRVTFTRPDTYLPDWPGLPDPADAARAVIPAYLGAYGPATMDTFNQWLIRGALKKSDLKRWSAALVADGVLAPVEVDGEPLFALASEVDALGSAKPFDEVRLLPAFDQYVLGPGTSDTRLIAADRRAAISKAGGWISAVVVHRGRVAGVWETGDDVLDVTLFQEAGTVPRAEIEAEADRIGAHLGTTPKVTVTTA